MKKICSLILSVAMCAATVSTVAACGGGEAKIETYSISVTSSANGKVVSSASGVKQGESVTFTLAADDGYQIEGIRINGKKIEITGDTYTIDGITEDYVIEGIFSKPDTSVSFVTGEGAEQLQSVQKKKKALYGELPKPYCKGKAFIGWFDADGEKVTSMSYVPSENDIVLTAKWRDIDVESVADELKPFCATSAYYDTAATSYGVVWHTEIAPYYPVAQVVQTVDGQANFEDASVVTIKGTTSSWNGEYVTNAVVADLEYATEYAVRFGDFAADIWGETYTFTTREEIVDGTRFFYVNDTQETYRIENQMKDGMTGGEPYIGETTYFARMMQDATMRFPEADFIMHGGDIVNYGALSAYWHEMLGSVEEYLFNLPMMAVAGNHEDPDWYSPGVDTVNKLFNVQWSGSASMRGVYYSFDYGSVHFVCINSNEVYESSNPKKLSSAQISWLENDLAEANANEDIKWTIAMMHIGPFAAYYDAANGNLNMVPYLNEQLSPVFTEYGLDLLLYGHSHYLSSSYPLVYDERATEVYDGVTHVGYVTTTTKQTTLADETVVDEFVYGANATSRGTIYHQTGASGSQFDWRFKNSERATNLAAHPHYRALVSGGNYTGSVCYSMYSYIEATDETLVVRTYGVDVMALSNALKGGAEVSLDYGAYIDGFMLRK